jgi:small subunit ribosomal protein S2
MAVVTMRQLLESGVHFGHQTRRWNPKMKRFIFTERNGIYIIDLQQSLAYIDNAFAFVKDTVARGGSVLFVGTKKQAQEAIAEQATRVGQPYVNQRWLGGMLTNFQTVHERLKRLKELDEVDFDDVVGSGRTKKELLQMKRERDKLERSLGGIREMGRTPAAVWIVDTKKEHLAVAEARKLHIPIIAILDTNCDPDDVDYPIPGNDDAIRSVTLLTRVLADAVAEGHLARSGAKGDETTGAELAVDEPLAEWERELYSSEAARVASVPPAADAGVASAATAPGASVATAPAAVPATPDPVAAVVAPADEATAGEPDATAQAAAALAEEALAAQALAAAAPDAAGEAAEALAEAAQAAAAQAQAALAESAAAGAESVQPSADESATAADVTTTPAAGDPA